MKHVKIVHNKYVIYVKEIELSIKIIIFNVYAHSNQ